jgi:hypothetical protein
MKKQIINTKKERENMKTNLTKQEIKEMNFMKKEEAKQEKERAKEMSIITMKKKTSLVMILEHYSMDIHEAVNEEEENEMTDTFIRATEYVRELEENKEKEKKGVK